MNRLKRSDILIAERSPTFGSAISTTRVRVTGSGWAEITIKEWTATALGSERRIEHRFSDEELTTIRDYLAAVTPSSPLSLPDDVGVRSLCFRRDDAQVLVELGEASDSPEFEAVWALIHRAFGQ